MFPVENFSLFVLLGTFDPPVLWLDEAIPVSPLGVVDLYVPLLVGVSLFKTDEFVEICQHVDENAAVDLPLEEILEGEVYRAIFFEDIYHLANDVLEIEI